MTATVIDSLVVELGLDPSKFTRGQRDAVDSLRKFEDQAERSGKAIEAQSKKSLGLFSVLKREMLGVIGITVGGVEAKHFLNFITDLDASTGRLARTLGESAGEVSAWQGAIEQVGGTAEDANAALSGLSGEMSRFQLTGQSSILPVLSRLGIGLYDSNHNLKTASQLWLELADAVHGMDPRQAASFLQMIPGSNASLINFLLQGRAAAEAALAASRAGGGTTRESAAAAAEYQRQLSLLERTVTNLGRGIFGSLLPGLNALLVKLREKIGTDALGGKSLWDFLTTMPSISVDKGSAADVIWRGLKGEYGNDYSRFFRDLYTGWGDNGGTQAAMRAEGAAKLKQAFAATGAASNRSPTGEREAFIRATAAELGIDPNVAVAVAKSEGFYSAVGDRGSSFGDFQLHYGGIAPGMMQSGLGDVFTRTTGLDARDQRNWQAADRFALEYARDHGWGSWHGWHGAQFAGITTGVPQPPSGGVSIGNINVNVHANKVDADSVGRDVDAALRRSLTAGAANYGPQ
jgi:hypothetical protein